MESSVADAGQTIGEVDAAKATAGESIVSDGSQSGRQCDVGQGIAMVKGIVADGGHHAGEADGSKVVAAAERFVSDGSDT